MAAQGMGMLSTRFDGDGQVARGDPLLLKPSSDPLVLVPREVSVVGQVGNYRK